MNLHDIAYVDQERLDQYAEQLLGPSKIEKLPSWRVGLSLTGVSVEGAQSAHPRAFTNSEKIAALQQHLEEDTRLHRGRWTEKEHMRAIRHASVGPAFCLESCIAAPIRIPPHEASHARGFRIWFSRALQVDADHSGDAAGPLYLLEDGPKGDFGERSSSYSLLSALLDAIGRPRSVGPSPDSPLAQLMSSERSPANADALELALSTDPIGAPSALGAQVDPPRRIEVLYRCRHLFAPRGALRSGPATVAYPIFIRSA